MNRVGPQQASRAVVLAASLALACSLLAQAPTNSPALAPSNPPPARVSAMGLPPGKCPVDSFRELLAMTPAEQRQALTNRPAGIQRQILAKLREYHALSAEERELRLRATELRWYLLPLMKAQATNRLAQLAAIPAGIRPLVAERLTQWDSLPPSTQQQLLRNQATLPRLTSFQPLPPPLPPNLSPSRQEKLNPGLQHVRALSDKAGQKLADRFNDFFKLTPQEQKETLSTLSELEQRQLEKTLQDYETLSDSRRTLCLKSFRKFASLSPEDRQQFLESAEEWKTMTPTERQAWKDLVNHVAHLPPVPPRRPAPSIKPSLSSNAVAGTNQH